MERYICGQCGIIQFTFHTHNDIIKHCCACNIIYYWYCNHCCKCKCNYCFTHIKK